MTSAQREAERQVRIERRRKKNAPRGRKTEALFRLKNAVTAALQAARLDAIRRTRKGTGGEPRGKANPSLHARGGEFLSAAPKDPSPAASHRSAS